MSDVVQIGDVICELDQRGRLVECWLVLLVNRPEQGGGPAHVRRTGQWTASEDWPPGRPWRKAHHQHQWRQPKEAT